MSNKNDPFEIYNPVLKDIERQQQMIRNIVQPALTMQHSVAEIMASAMQPYIDQQSQYLEQMSSVLQTYIDQQTNFREQMLSATTANFSHALTIFNSNIKNILTGINISGVTKSLTQLTTLSERIASMDNEEYSEDTLNEGISIISNCEIELEDISINQMKDMLTNDYSDEKEYVTISKEKYDAMVSKIDIINNTDESIRYLIELAEDLRNEKNHKNSTNTFWKIIAKSITDALTNNLIAFAFALILFAIGYQIGNLETIKSFWDFFN